MKKILSILTVALFTFAAVPSFAEEPPELIPAPPAEKSIDSAPKHKTIHKAKKAHKVKKVHKAKKGKKAAKHKTRHHARKARH